MNRILFFTVICFSFLFSGFKPTAMAPMNWAGTWTTNMGDLTLTQNKNTVTGYSATRGNIMATYNATTNILSGSFVKDKLTGTFSIRATGSNVFAGTWKMNSDTKPRGEWKGTRKQTATVSTLPTTSAGSSISTREKNSVSWTGTWNTNTLGKLILVEDMTTKKVKGRYLYTRGDLIREGTIEGTTNYGNYANSRKWLSGTIREGSETGKFLLVLNFHNGDNLDQFSGQSYFLTELKPATPFEYMPVNMRATRASTAIPNLNSPMIR
ncbi:hypothetical protein ACFSQD_13625 [Flavihumibacter stibioxidans]|uniref:Lipocalin-like domain-containing protein n=1 Tax=Flavihumibacter stibioxidans TaxID=1834163 RepID=A0ABR7M9Q9_9BACT|nr:hypothetical protein [Flavihumibacter stibioxidans]MBC6491361.1 hypothetical protein [Flavihumibacter stibioxidans]